MVYASVYKAEKFLTEKLCAMFSDGAENDRGNLSTNAAAEQAFLFATNVACAKKNCYLKVSDHNSRNMGGQVSVTHSPIILVPNTSDALHCQSG